MRAVAVERQRDAHAVAALAAAREALAVGRGHAAGELEIARRAASDDRAGAPQLRGAARDGIGGGEAVPGLAEHAEAEPQRTHRLLRRDSHGRQRGARARLGAGARRAGGRSDALLVQQRHERVSVQALDQRQRVSRRALGARADERDARHPRRELPPRSSSRTAR